MSHIQNINPVVWKIPYGIKANCYLFALAPKVEIGGYANRPFKSTPGQKCEKFKNKNINFNDCDALSERIICDNPDFVKKILKDDRFDNYGSNHHVICSLLAPGTSLSRNDFHFLRRISFNTFMKSYNQFEKNMSLKCKEQVSKLKPQNTRWVWAHQRGWSTSGPVVEDASGNLILDPLEADFNYNFLNYSKVCQFFKVKSREATVESSMDEMYNNRSTFGNQFLKLFNRKTITTSSGKNNKSMVPRMNNKSMVPGTNTKSMVSRMNNKSMVPGTNTKSMVPRMNNKSMVPKKNNIYSLTPKVSKELTVYNKSINKKKVITKSNKQMIKELNRLFKSLPEKAGNYNSKSIKLPTKLKYGNLPVTKENQHHVTYNTPKFVLKIKDTKVAKINR